MAIFSILSNPNFYLFGALGKFSLFAGSSTLAVANPIDDVLEFFGATMVGE